MFHGLGLLTCYDSELISEIILLCRTLWKGDQPLQTQQKLHTHTHTRFKRDRTVTCYKSDLSSRQGGRPTTNKTATVLTTAKIWSWVPEGLNAKTVWLTDWLTVSCKVALILEPTVPEFYTKRLGLWGQILLRRWRRTGWTKQVARMGTIRNAYKL
jgi:hypothetical protein